MTICPGGPQMHGPAARSVLISKCSEPNRYQSILVQTRPLNSLVTVFVLAFVADAAAVVICVLIVGWLLACLVGWLASLGLVARGKEA